MARLRNYSYLLVIHLDLLVTIITEIEKVVVNNNENVLKNILFGKLPVMVNSSMCVTNKHKKKKMNVNMIMGVIL